MDTLAGLRRKLDGATDLKSVVRTMKAMAASNIGQYEMAVHSLDGYFRTVATGLVGYFSSEGQLIPVQTTAKANKRNKRICAIVFGSDQGLVGQFNDKLSDFVAKSFDKNTTDLTIWTVGERVQLLLQDKGFDCPKLYPVPNSVNAITPLVGKLLFESGEAHESGEVDEVYVFHNQPSKAGTYQPVMLRLLPLDNEWKSTLAEYKWPTNKKPQVAGLPTPTFLALVHNYLFVAMFRACAESLTSENASRLSAMQRAEKNIGELLEILHQKFHHLRQSLIDDELFDVVSGFEALKDVVKKEEKVS
jgi:F-type H+-transporting ATPase subunit gamma